MRLKVRARVLLLLVKGFRCKDLKKITLKIIFVFPVMSMGGYKTTTAQQSSFKLCLLN